MSDFAKVYEVAKAYDRFVKNIITCAENISVALTEGSVDAVLSIESPSLMPGQEYDIVAQAGVQPGTWFRYLNTPNIKLSQPATTTAAAQACIIQPTLAGIAGL